MPKFDYLLNKLKTSNKGGGSPVTPEGNVMDLANNEVRGSIDNPKTDGIIGYNQETAVPGNYSIRIHQSNIKPIVPAEANLVGNLDYIPNIKNIITFYVEQDGKLYYFIKHYNPDDVIPYYNDISCANNNEILNILSNNTYVTDYTSSAIITPPTTIDLGGLKGMITHPNGWIYCIPSYSPASQGIVSYNPIRDERETNSLVGSLSYGRRDGILGKNNKIYCTPESGNTILVIEPSADGKSDTRYEIQIVTGAFNYVSGCVGPDGLIYICPRSGTNLLVLDTTDDSITFVSSPLLTFRGYEGIAPTKDCRLIFTPLENGNGLIYDPATQTFESHSGYPGGRFRFLNGRLMSNGKNVYGIFRGPNFQARRQSLYGYDVDTGTIETYPLNQGRDNVTVIINLADGRILLSFNYSKRYFIVDPVTKVVEQYFHPDYDPADPLRREGGVWTEQGSVTEYLDGRVFSLSPYFPETRYMYVIGQKIPNYNVNIPLSPVNNHS